MEPPRRIKDLVNHWIRYLSPAGKQAISTYDLNTLVVRLEERLSDVIRPLMELDKEDQPMTQELAAAIGEALLEAAACMQSAPPRPLP
jgi:hypothetical protein